MFPCGASELRGWAFSLYLDHLLSLLPSRCCYILLSLFSDSGRVIAFGSNNHQQLGRKTAIETEFFIPTMVAGLPRIKDIAAGWFHNFAIAAGTWCVVWQRNA